MRPAVAKPTAKTPDAAKTDKPVAHKRPELSVKDTRERERRASRIEKSSHVSRFSKGIFTPKISKRSEPLAVVAGSLAAPEAQAAHSFPKTSATEQFERAMHAAASHLIKSPVDHAKRTKRRRLQYASFGVFAVLGLGFLAYQYIPNVKVQVAATRAGFSADLPDYSPAGFGLSGPVEAEAGKVSFKYASRTDDKAFKITQTPSNWTSQSLLNNFVVSSNKPYQTYQDQGKTVYIYDNSNATWVDGGVWYQLEGDASLTSDQLLRIANSL